MTSTWDSAFLTQGNSNPNCGFTPWSTDLQVAKGCAGKDGVVIQAIAPPGSIHAVSRALGVPEEFEMHVPGIVQGTVIWGQ